MVIRDLANLAWGFAAQEQLDEEMMGSIAHQARQDANNFGSMDHLAARESD